MKRLGALGRTSKIANYDAKFLGLGRTKALGVYKRMNSKRCNGHYPADETETCTTVPNRYWFLVL